MPAKPPSQKPPVSFEAAVEELEKILHDLESGETALEQSLAQYERAAFLLAHCRGVLSDAEKKIETLIQTPRGDVVAQRSSDE